MQLHRRAFHQRIVTASALSALPAGLAQADHPNAPEFGFKYMLASCLYGYTKLEQILPEVSQVGAVAIDVWPRVHGNQREQLDAMGEAAFANQLQQHNVTLGCITQYKLGPFGLQQEMRLAQRLGCQTIVTGGRGPVGLRGSELKAAVRKFVQQMQTHLEVAAETNVDIAIENHANNLIFSPDSMKWLMEFSPGSKLGIALAPYHLEQDSTLLADLIRSLGNRIKVFYAWQHGKGCMEKLPKQEELLQMPGRGELDFAPLVDALKDIRYAGWTEIFMHPVPRGIAILDTTQQVTAEINRARRYLEQWTTES